MGTCAHAIVNLLFFHSVCYLFTVFMYVYPSFCLCSPPARDVAKQNSS